MHKSHKTGKIHLDKKNMILQDIKVLLYFVIMDIFFLSIYWIIIQPKVADTVAIIISLIIGNVLSLVIFKYFYRL